MATIKLNAGMASTFFMTDVQRNLVLLDNPYLIFSSSMLIKSGLAQILARIYNIEHPKGFLGIMPQQAEKEPIEKLLEDIINERKFFEVLMGSSRSMLIFAKGIEKTCLFAMKVLKIRGISSLTAINIRNDYERTFELIEGAEEIKKSGIYRDAVTTIYRPSKLRIAIGKDKTIISTDIDLRALVKENPDLITPVFNMPITDNRQIIDEGTYD